MAYQWISPNADTQSVLGGQADALNGLSEKTYQKCHYSFHSDKGCVYEEAAAGGTLEAPMDEHKRIKLQRLAKPHSQGLSGRDSHPVPFKKAAGDHDQNTLSSDKSGLQDTVHGAGLPVVIHIIHVAGRSRWKFYRYT